jgi:hypothetical protein
LIKGYPDTPGIYPDTPDIPDRDLETPPLVKGYPDTPLYVRILWTLFSDIPDKDPKTPVLAETLSKYHFEVVFVAHKYLYGFS